MKKQLSTLTLGLALLASLSGFAQEGVKYPCYTDEATKQYFELNPSAKTSFEATRIKWQEDIQKNNDVRGKSASASVYTVPVVFHVLHAGGVENINDATIMGALDYVNKDYERTNTDANTVAAPFQSLYINSDIKFMLAKKDPNGNCTSGIVRHVDPVKMTWSQASANSASYWSYTWDPTKYLNVYVVASIVSQGTVAGGGIIVGYTYIPGTHSTGAANDAIVFNGSFLLTDPRSLSHEIGHWLSLQHTWGMTNAPGVSCGDDLISDTPQTKGNLFNCPSSLSGNACDVTGTDNVENIMNYASCPKNFTTGQTNAMRTTLASGPVGRPNLSSPGNLTATGIGNTSPCAPIADFLSVTNKYLVCSGGALTMKDASYNGTVTSWAWSGTNGAILATPTASSTGVTFPTPGTSVITLTVTNGQGSSVVSRTVTVQNGVAVINQNYVESFEAAGLPASWSVTNPNAGSVTWDQTTLGASEGASSYYIEGLINPLNQIDYLNMPVLNATDPNDTIFTFKFAYQRYNATNSDKFEVQASTDCGGTWQTIVSLTAAQMANLSAGINSNPYVPNAADWVRINIYNYPNWGNIQGNAQVLVRFMFQEGNVGFGNRFYLDEINFLTTPVGINELAKSIHFVMYPNPTSAETVIKYNLTEAANVKMSVTDILGKEVLPATNISYAPGEQVISINKNNTLSKGVYFVNLNVNGAKMCKKLVIQ
jgi:hypothetical protein